MREVSHEMNEEQKRVEAKRLADVAEAKGLADVAEKRRLADVAEAKRLADNTTGAKVKRSLRNIGKSLRGK